MCIVQPEPTSSQIDRIVDTMPLWTNKLIYYDCTVIIYNYIPDAPLRSKRTSIPGHYVDYISGNEEIERITKPGLRHPALKQCAVISHIISRVYTPCTRPGWNILRFNRYTDTKQNCSAYQYQ